MSTTAVELQSVSRDVVAPSTPSSGGTVAAHPVSKSRSKLQIAVIMTCLCLCVFVAALDVTIVTTALPTIAHQFDSTSGYTWIGTAFTLAHTASTPSWGKLSDIWGRKPILLGANAIFFIGSLMCALVTEMDAFIAGRAIQGLGAGGMLSIVNICISDLFSQRDRGFYFALTSISWAVASGVGPALGGVFTSKLSWRWCFWLNLPITGVTFPLLYFALQLQNPRTPMRAGLKAIDWTGSFLIIGGAVMLLLGLHLGGVHSPWNSATVVCLVVFGVITSALFILNEWKFAVYPLMPIRLFQSVSSSAAYAVCFLQGFSFLGVAYYLPLYFQSVLSASPLMSGVYLIPFFVSSAVMAAAAGIFIQSTGKYLPTLWTGLAAMTLGIGLFINLDMDAKWAKVIIYQLIAGAGSGMSTEGPLLAAQAAMPAQDMATTTATLGFVRSMSSAISIVVGGVIFQNEMSKKAAALATDLGPEIAQLLSGANAAANVEVVHSLPQDLRTVAVRAFYESTRSMWILYLSFAVAGLLMTLFVRGLTLSKVHEETRVGLDRGHGDGDQQATVLGGSQQHASDLRARDT